MILHALSNYYVRLDEDPEIEMAPYGKSLQKIAFCVVLNADGTLHDIQDVRETDGKKDVTVNMIVPGGAKSPGAGMNPNLFWDNTGYMLGFKPDDEKPERTLQSFEAFRQRHLDMEAAIDDVEFSAVCRFLENWNPNEAADNVKAYPFLLDLKSGFGVFRIRNIKHYVHDNTKIESWWKEQTNKVDKTEEVVTGQCLVTGETTAIARLHEPKIKGVWGAQSSGASIVSFNCSAFESYGKEQSYNAPVNERFTFQYGTALNHLLRKGSSQCIQIGDATTVFWTEKPSPIEGWFGEMMDPSSTEDETVKNQLQGLLNSIAKGRFPSELGDPETKFFILGLSPNASRLSVRFWHVSNVGEMVAHLKDHFQDMELIHSERDPDYPSLWQILKETARESKDIPPQLAGPFIRSILQGFLYPESLYTAMLRRMRADQEVRYIRVAMLKATLNRKKRLQPQYPLTKEISMSLDPDRTEPAYLLGRLFAVLEKIQEDALPGINATIKDRFFGAASATPVSVFPRLIRLSQHHLSKLEKKFSVPQDKRLQQIMENLSDFPSHLNLQQQGLFAIGYYHQRQNFFIKKSDSTTNPKEN